MNDEVIQELLKGFAADELAKQIEAEKDDAKALRQALLFLTFLTQVEASPAQKRFIEFLLTKFPALLKGLKQHKLPFLFDMDFTVAKGEGDRVGVHIPRQFAEKAAEQIPEGSPIMSHTYLDQVKKRFPFSEWQPITRRYIGFFDHMGFKNTVTRYEGEYEKLHEILQDVEQNISETQKFASQRNSDNKYESDFWKGETPSGMIKCFQFSDTIMIATKDDSEESNLVLLLASIALFNRLISDGMMLRGAISCGTTVIDFEHNIFFGEPIIKAYELEQAQQWYGVAIDASADSDEIDPDMPELEEGYIPLTISYPIPLKATPGSDDTVYKTMSALNWPALLGKDIEAVKNILSPSANPGDKKLNKYYNHTLSFVEESFRAINEVK